MLEAINHHRLSIVIPELRPKITQSAAEIYNRHILEARDAISEFFSGVGNRTDSFLSGLDRVRKNITTSFLKERKYSRRVVRAGLAMIVLGSLLLTACAPQASAAGVITPEITPTLPVVTQSVEMNVNDVGPNSPRMLAYQNFNGCKIYNGPITEQHLQSNDEIYAFQQIGASGNILSVGAIDDPSDIPVALPGERIEIKVCSFPGLNLGPAPDNPLRDAAEIEVASNLR